MRPRKRRFIHRRPRVIYYKPRGIPLSKLQELELKVEELEALRFADYQGLKQEEACKLMNVSRPTFQRILASGRKKVAEALVLGKAIQIKGGDFQMAPRGFGRRQASPGGGRGRMGGPYAAGPGGMCVCTKPDCKYEEPHVVGQPCQEKKCPKCDSPMTRKA